MCRVATAVVVPVASSCQRNCKILPPPVQVPTGVIAAVVTLSNLLEPHIAVSMATSVPQVLLMVSPSPRHAVATSLFKLFVSAAV